MDRFNGAAAAAAAAAMQFSPGPQMNNNNQENFLMFDPPGAGQHSPTSSLDLDSFNPSSLTADISAFFDHDHDQAEPALSQDVLLATDRWSGTTTTTNNNSNSGSSNNNNVPCNSSSNNANNNMAQSSRQAQAPQSSSPSQCQSSVSQGQSSNPEGNSCNQQQQQQQQLPSQPYASSFDKSMWDASHSSADVFAMQQQQQRNQEEAAAQQQGDHPNSGRNNGNKAAAVLSPKENVKKRPFSALHTSSGQAGMFPMQQQDELPDHHQAQQQPQVEGPGGGLQAGYMRQQQANCSHLSPQESAASQQAAKNNTAQPMDYEQSSQTFSFNGDSKMTMHPNHNENIPPGAGGGSMYHRIDSESQQSSRLQGVQHSNNMIFQRASANAHVLNTMQQGDLQNDLVMQNMQRLGIPMQGLTPQLQEHIMNLRSPAGNNLALSAILQNPAVRQGPIQMPSLSHAHGQGQGANQTSPMNHQAFLQARNLLPGLPQASFPNSQQVSFHLARASSNQLQQHALNSGSQLAGMPHLTQIPARAQNPMLQGMRFGNRHVLQSLPSAPTNYTGNAGDMVVKRMPGNIAFRCVEIIMQFMQEQRKRPQDNSIVFWRKLVQDFYAPVALERWCLSSYSSSPMTKNAQGLFPMEYWLCNICGKQPGRGFEYSTDVLPRLLKIKYDSGLLDELLFLESPEESYVVHPGKLVVEFPHAVHESVFQELRVVRNGRLRVSFNNSLKILSWEFCCESHCEAVPRKNLLQQAQQLSALVNEAEQEGFDKDPSNLKNHCNMFTACAKQLKGKLEAPNVNDLGFSKRHVRCLQIAEVVNSMKDLISFERRTGLGPIESLNKFPTIRKMQAQGSIPPPALNQVTSQLPQAGNPTSPSKLPSRLPVPARPTLGFNQQPSPSSSVLQGNDPLLAKISSNVNPMQAQLRSNLEQRSLNMMQPQANGQMQPPSISHLETSGQGQSDPSNQYLSHFTPGHSPVQGQHLGQLSSPVSGLVSSQNTSHLSQQPYDQGVSKQMIYGSPNQIITQSRSLNRTGQQSLPGTPQSELSDMRSNP